MTATRVDLFRRPTEGTGLRFALVRPPVVVFPRSLSTSGPVPPLGMAYVAAALREVGHEVQLIDAAGEGLHELQEFETPVGWLRRVGLSPEEAVARIHPDTRIIGIGNMFLHEWPQAQAVANAARERFPDALIVMGGENATSYWKWILEQCPAVDVVVRGEGEMTTVELANRVAEGQPFTDMDAVVVRAGVADPKPGLPTRIRRLAEVPRPAWDLVPLENYWQEGNFFGVEHGRSMPMLATRGCPYKCSFCSAPQMWTTRYNVREPADLADEIADYADRFGIQNIDLCDLTPITKRKWTLEFCDELDARGVHIAWQIPVGTRSESLDPEVLQRLKDTGCRNITYAPESGSDRMLKMFDKKLDLPALLASMREAKQIGLTVHMNSLIGHPAETRWDLLLTWWLFVKAAWAGCDTAAPMMFCPYPGSADFDALISAGKLEVNEETVYVGLSRGSSAHRSFNPHISARGLRWAQITMLLTFYGLGSVLHPSRLVRYVKAFRRGKDETAHADETNHIEQAIRIKRSGILQAAHRN